MISSPAAEYRFGAQIYFFDRNVPSFDQDLVQSKDCYRSISTLSQFAPKMSKDKNEVDLKLETTPRLYNLYLETNDQKAMMVVLKMAGYSDSCLSDKALNRAARCHATALRGKTTFGPRKEACGPRGAEEPFSGSLYENAHFETTSSSSICIILKRACKSICGISPLNLGIGSLRSLG